MHPLLQDLLDNYRNEDYVPPKLEIPITQHNLVLVVNYGKAPELLPKFSQHHLECRRSMVTFPCLMKRFRYPGVTLMEFPSGAAVFVGGYNFPSTLYVALLHRIAKEAFRREFAPHVPASTLLFGSPHKANHVFTAELPGGPFDLAEIFATVPGVKYNPLKFPGANMTLLDDNGNPLATVVFFELGLTNLMGCKTFNDALRALTRLYEIVRPFTCAPRENREDIVRQREAEKLEAVAQAHKYMSTHHADDVQLNDLFTNANEADEFAQLLLEGGDEDNDFDIVIK